MQTERYQTTSTTETEAIGASLASRFLKQPSALPHYVALYGDLGVGKTAFVRGFASVMAPDSAVRSPTFALVHEHRGKILDLFHFDMYRITGEDDLYSIGYEDYLTRRGVCIVEWSENIPFALPDEYVRVTITKCDPTQPDLREICVEHVKEALC